MFDGIQRAPLCIDGYNEGTLATPVVSEGFTWVV